MNKNYVLVIFTDDGKEVKSEKKQFSSKESAETAKDKFVEKVTQKNDCTFETNRFGHLQCRMPKGGWIGVTVLEVEDNGKKCEFTLKKLLFDPQNPKDRYSYDISIVYV